MNDGGNRYPIKRVNAHPFQMSYPRTLHQNVVLLQKRVLQVTQGRARLIFVPCVLLRKLSKIAAQAHFWSSFSSIE